MSSPGMSPPGGGADGSPAGEDGSPAGEEDYSTYQGPHNWRKSLKHVDRDPDGEDSPTGTGSEPQSAEKTPEKGPTKKRRSSRDERSDDSSKGKTKTKTGSSRSRQGSGLTRHRHSTGGMTLSAPDESPFQRLVANRPTSPNMARRRLHPSSRASVTGLERKPSFGGHPVTRRSTSLPTADMVLSSADAIKKRIEKVMKARLYLLQQTGPNSFLIGGDSPDHKYRVIIGPQRCSCGRGPQCVHILFVMLRVFQLPENDPCLWSKTLKNFEVETLFNQFRERRSSLIHNLSKKRRRSKVSEQSAQEQPSVSEEPAEGQAAQEEEEQEGEELKDEEATCPICLLEMVEGESLTECINGCGNKLHHHCIAVWFEECHRQNEPLICPLCRAHWKHEEKRGSVSTDAMPVPPNTRASSPQPTSSREDYIALPHTEPIPAEQHEVARPWIPVLGEELVSCLFSRNWVAREIGLKQLSRMAVGSLLLTVGEGREGAQISAEQAASTRAMLRCCCSVLAVLCADPVYKVFVAGLRCLRNVLSFTPCRNSEQQQNLQSLLIPVIKTLLLKCADSNKRTSQLSLSALEELVKGQEGELAVGREIVNPGVCGVGGVAFVLDVVHSSEVPDTAGVGAGSGGGAGWQWLLGCLCMLQRLLEEHPTEFMISTPRGDASNVPLEQFTHFERIVKMLRFTMAAMSNSHQKVGRMARKCFLTCSRLQVHHLPFLQRIMQLIGELPGDQRSTLQQRLHRLAAEYNIAQHVVAGMTHCSNSFESTTDSDPPQLFSTPAMSENSTPRSVTPEPKPINVTVNNFITGNLNFMPTAPPNSPARRHMTHRKTASTSTQDDMSSDALSTSEAAPSVDESVMTECTDDCEDEASDMPTTLTVRGMPSGASATELGLPLTDDEEGDDSVLGEPLPDTSLTSEPPAQPQETLHFIPETEAAGSCSPPEGISECSGNATQASSSGPSLVEDFTDLTMSPSRPEEHISFKTEISAGSPQHFPGRSQRGQSNEESCHCKEEVEKEEAEALVEALEQSSQRQLSLPFIPGLSRNDSQETIVIRVQEENADIPAVGELEISAPSSYLEGVHWQRGFILGTGAFSTCYQARDVKTGTLMAVKQISYCRNSMSEQEEVMETVVEEIIMMSRLNQPNIVRILGATRQGLHFFMFLEWMPGGSISHLLERYGPFAESVIINYIQQILRGLAYLHENHLLHRDLKGANIMLDSTGQQARIGDFGAAARLASRQTAAGEFQGQLLGTIAFMAPEVLRGESYGRSCDVWSVGCVMIEMATGKPPWGARDISNHLALIFKIASAVTHPPIPEGLDPGVRDLLLRCLECQREDRPPAKDLLKHPLFTMKSKR